MPCGSSRNTSGVSSYSCPSRCAVQEDDRQQADCRKGEVGEGIAPEIRKEASHGGTDSVTGGPSEVRDREGHGPFHPGLLGAPREERCPWDERRVEGPGREHDEKPDHPGVPSPRQEEKDADRGEQPDEDRRTVARPVGPAAEQRMDERFEHGAYEKDRPHRRSTPSEPVEIQRYQDGQRAEEQGGEHYKPEAGKEQGLPYRRERR